MTQRLVKIWDGSFGHSRSVGGDYIAPKYFEWWRPQYTERHVDANVDTPVTFYTDMCFDDYVIDEQKCEEMCTATQTPRWRIPHVPTSAAKKKIAWILEPWAINGGAYGWIAQRWQYFDAVVTHQRRLAESNDRFIWLPHGGTWVQEEHHRFTGLREDKVSIIASDKMGTLNQRMRHQIMDELEEVYGLACFSSRWDRRTHVKDKSEVLHKYRWSIVIENCIEPGYFTEKLLDCIATYCVPIYYGDPEIGKIFNTAGIPTFSTIEELETILCDLPIISQAVLEENYERARPYFVPEDWLYENIIKEYMP